MGRSAGCLLLAMLAAATLACREEGLVEVCSLKFEGVEHIDESALKSALATHVNSKLPWGRKAYFDRSRFEDDLKRIRTFYVDRGYGDARVTGFDARLNDKQDGVDITVRIAEGSPTLLRALNFVGFEVIPVNDLEVLKKQAPLKVGEPRDRQLVLSTYELALNALRDRGYPYAAVAINEESGEDRKSSTLTLTASPGPLAHFGPIQITGNDRVSDRVIRRGLAYKEGELYRRSQVQETQRRLYATQLFQFVSVAPLAPGTKSTEPSTSAAESAEGTEGTSSVAESQPVVAQPRDVPTGITVAEGKPQRVTFGVGYGTEEKARGDIQYRRLNFLGAGRTAEAHLRWSSLDRGARLNFTQPNLFASRLTLGLLGQQWYTYTPAYRSLARGGKATLTYRTGPRNYWSLSWTSERDNSTIAPDVLGNLELRNHLIALGLNPVSGEQRGTLNAVGASFQRSTTNNALNATRGYQVTLRFEQAGRFLPGNFEYWSLSIDGRHHLPLGSRFVWSNRAQVGNIAPPAGDVTAIPFGKRFFLGGSTSLRGWGIYEVGPLAEGLPIGGNSMVAFSSELRAPLQGNLGAVLFVDGGNVWADSFGIQLRDLRYAVGSGLRYQTPVGPIRFDVGYQLNPEPGLLVNGSPQHRRWRMHFSVGQAF